MNGMQFQVIFSSDVSTASLCYINMHVVEISSLLFYNNALYDIPIFQAKSKYSQNDATPYQNCENKLGENETKGNKTYSGC